MNIFMTIYSLINLLNLSQNSKEPVRLEKKELTTWESFCQKACPYVIISCVIILSVLLFIALAKYGHAITGTEANQWYYHSGV